MQVRGRPEAAAVVWNPLGESEPGESSGLAARTARRRGAVQALVAAAAATLLFFFWSPLAARIVSTIALLLLLCSQASPLGAYARIERGFAALGRWTGEGLTVVLMTIVFYLLFLPFSVLFRRGQRDSMKRYYERERDSYWETRDSDHTASASHTRQY